MKENPEELEKEKNWRSRISTELINDVIVLINDRLQHLGPDNLQNSLGMSPYRLVFQKTFHSHLELEYKKLDFMEILDLRHLADENAKWYKEKTKEGIPIGSGINLIILQHVVGYDP